VLAEYDEAQIMDGNSTMTNSTIVADIDLLEIALGRHKRETASRHSARGAAFRFRQSASDDPLASGFDPTKRTKEARQHDVEVEDFARAGALQRITVP
jgi:hypothetical protein